MLTVDRSGKSGLGPTSLLSPPARWRQLTPGYATESSGRTCHPWLNNSALGAAPFFTPESQFVIKRHCFLPQAGAQIHYSDTCGYVCKRRALACFGYGVRRGEER